jgi:hypothetical protein
MYNHVTELNASLREPRSDEDYVEEVKNVVVKYFDEQLASE